MSESHPPKKKAKRPKLERKASLNRGGRSAKKSLRKQAAKQQRDKELFTGTFLPPGAGPQTPDYYGSSSWDKQPEILQPLKPEPKQSSFSNNFQLQTWRDKITSLWKKKGGEETALQANEATQKPKPSLQFKKQASQTYTQVSSWVKESSIRSWAWICNASKIPFQAFVKGFYASRILLARWFGMAVSGFFDAIDLISKQISSFFRQVSAKIAAERNKKKQPSNKPKSPEKKQNR